jgi:hypothetical protein
MPIMPNKRQIKAAKTATKMTKADKSTMKAAGIRRAVVNAQAIKKIQATGGGSVAKTGTAPEHKKMNDIVGKLRGPAPGTAGTKKGAGKLEQKTYTKASSKISNAQAKLAKAKKK